MAKDKSQAIETIQSTTLTEETKQKDDENENNSNNNNNNNSKTNNEDAKSHQRRASEIQSTSEDFYDEFQLKMSNIQLILINKVCFCFSSYISFSIIIVIFDNYF